MSSHACTRTALIFSAPYTITLEHSQLPAAQASEVLVRAIASTVSRGTELLLYRGEVDGGFDGGAGGEAPYPRNYGYSWVGDMEVGDHVFGLLPHASHHVVAASHVRRIRAALAPITATLAANVETAVNAIWDAKLYVGAQCIVFGGGVVGLLIAWLARKSGAHVQVVEPNAARRALALKLDLRAVGEASLVAHAENSDGADIVFEASGNPTALQHALGAGGFESRVVAVSCYGERHGRFPLNEIFHRKRQTIVSSQVSSLPSTQARRWNHDRRFALVLDLLADPALAQLVAHHVPFGDAARAYAELAASEDTLTTTLIY
jgi:threonine dehydrogenase-like Zn-dependent dehydrogenase